MKEAMLEKTLAEFPGRVRGRSLQELPSPKRCREASPRQLWPWGFWDADTLAQQSSRAPSCSWSAPHLSPLCCSGASLPQPPPSLRLLSRPGCIQGRLASSRPLSSAPGAVPWLQDAVWPHVLPGHPQPGGLGPLSGGKMAQTPEQTLATPSGPLYGVSPSDLSVF